MKHVWEYVNYFAEFNRFTNSPVANYYGELYSLPFNMYTFNKMWGVVAPVSYTHLDVYKRQGIQLTVTNSDSKVVLSVYNGKKGIKFVWGGTASELRSQLEAVLTGKDTADKVAIVPAIGNDYTLLRNCADFKGIWAGSDESGKGDFFGPLVVAAAVSYTHLDVYKRQVQKH